MSLVASICPTPGCGTLTDGGHCPPHSKQQKQRDNRRRNSHPRRQVYDHPEWPTTRGVVFLRDEFRCVRCRRPVGPGTEAGPPVCAHRRPIAELRELGLNPFDPEQCETQCLSCSGKEDGKRSRRR